MTNSAESFMTEERSDKLRQTGRVDRLRHEPRRCHICGHPMLPKESRCPQCNARGNPNTSASPPQRPLEGSDVSLDQQRSDGCLTTASESGHQVSTLDPDCTVCSVSIDRCGRVATRNEGGQHQFGVGAALGGRYLVQRQLGQGGMGRVLLALDTRLQRMVAVKVVIASVMHDRATVQKLNELFVKEARLGARLTHPNIASVYDFGIHEDQVAFTVFEYIPGRNLRSLMADRGRLRIPEVLAFLGPVGEALDYAHQNGIIHRDLKPENIQVTPQHQFKILDLGLARDFIRDADWCFSGTPAYASPEQAAELPADGRGDQYALALIVYEMLTGVRPFQSNDPLELLRMHREQPVTDPRCFHSGISEAASDALLRALSKRPEERFRSCRDFATAMGCQLVFHAVDPPEVLCEAAIRPPEESGTMGLGRRHLALAENAIWVNDDGELWRCPLVALKSFRKGLLGRSLEISVRDSDGDRDERFVFKRRSECQRFHQQLVQLIQSRIEDQTAEQIKPESPSVVESVVLVEHPTDIAHQVLGSVRAALRRKGDCRASLEIRAAIKGANAVLSVVFHRRPMPHTTLHEANGIAVRVQETDSMLMLRSQWMDGRCRSLGITILWLGGIFLSLELLHAPVAAGMAEAPLGPVLVVILLIALWPMVLGFGIAYLRWPQLIPPAANALKIWAIVPPAIGLATALSTMNWQPVSVRSGWGSFVHVVCANFSILRVVAAVIPFWLAFRAERLETRFNRWLVETRDTPDAIRQRLGNDAETVSLAYLAMMLMVGMAAFCASVALS